MTYDSDQFKQAWRTMLGNSVREPVQARLGNPGDGKVVVPADETDTDGMIYIHAIGPEKDSVGMALNTVLKADELTFGAPVMVAFDGTNYRIVDKDPQLWGAFIKELYIPDQRSINIDQIQWGTMRPVSPDTTMQAVVEAAVYTLRGTRYYVATQLTKDFSGDIPSTPGDALGVLVMVAPDTGNLSYTSGSVYNASIVPVDALAQSLLPTTMDSDKYGIGWIILINGMSSIVSGRNILNAPEFLSKGSFLANDIVTAEGRVVVDTSGNVVTA